MHACLLNDRLKSMLRKVYLYIIMPSWKIQLIYQHPYIACKCSLKCIVLKFLLSCLKVYRLGYIKYILLNLENILNYYIVTYIELYKINFLTVKHFNRSIYKLVVYLIIYEVNIIVL